jgi:DNA-binding NarL/FixJ family response regulator
VLVVDDHPVVRQGLRSFLDSRDGIEVVGEGSTAEEAVAEAERLTPDVVVLDLLMPGGSGLDAIARIRAVNPPAPRVLVLTSFAGDDQVLPAVRAGASGYLLKDVAAADLEAAIRTLHAGGALLAPQVTAAVLDEVSRGADPRLNELTAREREVLGLLGLGLSNKDLAARLFVSEKTVKTHVSSILAKLGLTDRTQAALFAVRHGLVDDEEA